MAWFDTDQIGAVLNWSSDGPSLLGYAAQRMRGQPLPVFVITNRPSCLELLRVVMGDLIEREGQLRPVEHGPVSVHYSVILSPDSSDLRPLLRWTFKLI